MYTKLELVNHILTTLGESTTPTLETQHPAVQQAISTLDGCNKEFQGMGWWFNREHNVKLLPNSEGRVRVPTEILSFRVTRCLLDMRMPVQKQRFLVRGNFVYDNINHTNVLNVAVWSDYTTLLAIEDLPTNAGTYLKHYAAEQAFIQDDGDIQVHTRLLQRVDKAWALLRKDEMQAVSANALESPYAMRLRMGPGSHSPRAEFLGGGNLR